MATIPQLDLNPIRQAGMNLGGNNLQAPLAEAQGESLGANTANAIAEAQLRIQQKKARDEYKATLAGDKALAPHSDAISAILQGGQNPENAFSAGLTGQKVDLGTTIANAQAPQAERVAAAQALSPGGLANPLSDANAAFLGARTDATRSLIDPNVRKTNAQAALFDMQAKHPELFHPQSALNLPPNQAHLQELYRLGVLDPSTASRAAISGNAVEAAYYAAHPEEAPTFTPAAGGAAPGAAPAPAPVGGAAPAAAPAPVGGAAPAAAAPPARAPLPAMAPGGNAHSEILLSDKQFASLKPTDPGGKIANGNKLTAHLGLLQQLHDAQKANDLPTVQRAYTALTGQSGSDIPTMNSLASRFVGDELAAFLAQNNGSLEDRNDAQSHFNQNNIGAEQLQGNITLGRELMGGQFAGLKKGYSTPTARTDAQVDGFSRRFMLDPSVLDAWEAKHGKVTRGGAAAPAAPGAAPAAAPAAAPSLQDAALAELKRRGLAQ